MTEARDVIAHFLRARHEKTISLPQYQSGIIGKIVNQIADEEAAAILSALTEAGFVVERGWRPIEEAPKDGRHILAFPVLLDRACVVSWEAPARTPPMMRVVSQERHDHNGFWRMAMSMARAPYEPTHFRDLPSSPEKP